MPLPDHGLKAAEPGQALSAPPRAITAGTPSRGMHKVPERGAAARCGSSPVLVQPGFKIPLTEHDPFADLVPRQFPRAPVRLQRAMGDAEELGRGDHGQELVTAAGQLRLIFPTPSRVAPMPPSGDERPASLSSGSRAGFKILYAASASSAARPRSQLDGSR